MPLGSPTLDLLVTGDDSNIQFVLQKFKAQSTDLSQMNGDEVTTNSDEAESTAERLKSKVDESMPAQAVANWVQCENPKCLKWRKLPWHVDIDLLPEAFYCKDNQWNPDSNICDSPVNAWDDCDAPVKFNDSTTEMQEDLFQIEPEPSSRNEKDAISIVDKKIPCRSHQRKRSNDAKNKQVKRKKQRIKQELPTFDKIKKKSKLKKYFLHQTGKTYRGRRK